jgi:histidyl-tRNA synthetase
MARKLRGEGIGVEVFPEPKKIGHQLQYAEKRGFKAALIAGSAEFEQGVWKVKNLATRTETAASHVDVVAAVRAILKSDNVGAN